VTRRFGRARADEAVARCAYDGTGMSSGSSNGAGGDVSPWRYDEGETQQAGWD
jgi:hypothetical protein